MLRLLFCTSSLAWGGAERQTIALLNRLAEQGHHCALVHLKDEAGQLDRVAPALRDTVRGLHARRYIDTTALRAYAQVVARFEPDAVVAVNPYALLYSSIARAQARRPPRLLHTFHSTTLHGAKEALQMLAYRPLFWLADCTVFVCERQRRHWLWRGALSRRNEVIHNGIDLREFSSGAESGPDPAALRAGLGLDQGDYVIGLNAAMRPEKNHLQLVDAVALLRGRGLPARALMIGDGPMRAAVRAHAERLGVGADVIITGFQRDVRPCLRACDAVVLCSLSTEALSLAVIEAMALRRPVVLSDVGGASELVVPGDNGFLFPPGDTGALVGQLALLADGALARRMGEASHRRAHARFSETVMVARYAQVLHELCRSGAGRLAATGGNGGG